MADGKAALAFCACGDGAGDSVACSLLCEIESAEEDGSGCAVWPCGIPASAEALVGTRTLRIGKGLIVSTGFAWALPAIMDMELAPLPLGSNVSDLDDLSCALLETPCLSPAWPAPTLTIAAPITIPNRIETTATRSSRRSPGDGQKYPKSG
jgi:hypothetical protein